jgi:hypothetical protein
LALILSHAPLNGCQSTGNDGTTASYPPIVASTFGEMRNVSVCGPIWFGGRPCDQDLELAKRRGIQRIIDLSLPLEEGGGDDVAAACRNLKLEYLKAALSGEDQLSDTSVDLVLGWLEPVSPMPTLMFDGTGGRCATYLAIYRAVRWGVPLDQALIEARRAGMKPGPPEGFVRAQVERLTGPALAEAP